MNEGRRKSASYATTTTPGRWQSKTPILSRNVDQKSIETVFSIALCRHAGDKWQSKTLFLSIFGPRSSIVDSVYDCRLPGVTTCTSQYQATKDDACRTQPTLHPYRVTNVGVLGGPSTPYNDAGSATSSNSRQNQSSRHSGGGCQADASGEEEKEQKAPFTSEDCFNAAQHTSTGADGAYNSSACFSASLCVSTNPSTPSIKMAHSGEVRRGESQPASNLGQPSTCQQNAIRMAFLWGPIVSYWDVFKLHEKFTMKVRNK